MPPMRVSLKLIRPSADDKREMIARWRRHLGITQEECARLWSGETAGNWHRKESGSLQWPDFWGVLWFLREIADRLGPAPTDYEQRRAWFARAGELLGFPVYSGIHEAWPKEETG